MSNTLKETINLNSRIKQYYEKKEEEMLQCDHLLLKTKEGESYLGFHSSDCGIEPSVVCCVKCGFTSQYIMHDMHSEKKYQFLYPDYYYNILVNNAVFKKQFGKGWYRSGKSFDDSVFDDYLISKTGVIPTQQPVTLYKIAKKINKEGTNDELFTIMSNLYEIMTTEEKNKISFNEHELELLLNRYNSLKGNTLKKSLNNKKTVPNK